MNLDEIHIGSLICDKKTIGKLIKKKLKDNGRSVAWLAKQVDCDCSNFHKKLNEDNLGIHLLLRISEILQEDFFVSRGKIYHKKW